MEPLNFPRDGFLNTYSVDSISTIAISSRDAIFPTDTASKFTVSISPLITPRTVQLLSCAITINNFNLTDPITLEENGFPSVQVTLPPAIYDDTNIAAALQVALNAASPAGNVYTVTLNPSNLTITITAVGVTWRFINLTVSNDTYYALGCCPTALPSLSPYSLSKTFGAYDLRPYDVLYLRISEFTQSNPVSTKGSAGAVFTLSCSSVNSGGVAIFTVNSNDNQYWINANVVTISQLSIQITDSRGRVIPLRAGSTNILLGFNRVIPYH